MPDRRRVLKIFGGMAATAFTSTQTGMLGQELVAAPSQSRPYIWEGNVLGAHAEIILDHPDAAALVAKSLGEIDRLENIFSLYRADSQLSELNREGKLRYPDPAFLALLSVADAAHQVSAGRFDPTIQPLWQLHAEAAVRGQVISADRVAAVKAHTGWQHVSWQPETITYGRKHMAMTLNGIAQGFIADRVAQQLREAGIDNVLVNTGEIKAMGAGLDGKPWQIKIAGREDSAHRVQDRAIATSASLATLLDATGKLGHIIDPLTGIPAQIPRQVTVVAKSAAMADALSTAYCLMDDAEIKRSASSAIGSLGIEVYSG